MYSAFSSSSKSVIKQISTGHTTFYMVLVFSGTATPHSSYIGIMEHKVFNVVDSPCLPLAMPLIIYRKGKVLSALEVISLFKDKRVPWVTPDSSTLWRDSWFLLEDDHLLCGCSLLSCPGQRLHYEIQYQWSVSMLEVLFV